MQRPIMDPTFLAHGEDHHKAWRRPSWMAWTTVAWRALRWVGRTLVSQPWAKRRRRLLPPDSSRAGRILRGVVYRLLFVPMIVALFSGALVFSGTHPRAAGARTDPASAGMYFEPVDLTSADNTRLKGWLVPVVDAARVLRERDNVFKSKHAAVVLAHDFGQSPAQLMPLVQPLHDDGFVVVAIGLRGVGGADRPAGQTFGVNESQDVLAAVEMLRRRPFVDPERVAVIGVGSGANAALLAADRDPQIASLVLAEPLATADDAIARWIGPDRWGTRWVQRVNKYAFEYVYRCDADDINLNRYPGVMTTRPVLTLDRATGEDGKVTPAAVERVRAFCQENLSKRRPVVAVGR